MTLIVSPLRHVERVIAQRRPSHLITLMDPDWMIDTHAAFAPERHLRLNVHDIEAPTPGLLAPDRALVERLLAFADTWDEAAPMLIHCYAGVSRSTASAFVLACARNPRGEEAVIASRLRDAAPHAMPNRLMVALADWELRRRGRMVAAVEAMGGGDFAAQGQPFDLPGRLSGAPAP